MLCRKNLFVIAATLLCWSIAGVNIYSQCGVHFRHKTSQVFPYSHVTLDYAQDMTADGKVDLIASNSNTSGQTFRRQNIFVIPSNGDGTFGSPIVISAPAGTEFTSDFAIADVNNDGLKDIVVAVVESTHVTRTYINNGNGTFTLSASSPYTSAVHALFDANADQFDDLHVGGPMGFNYRPGNGDGTFGATVRPINNINGGGQVSGDFNADGKIDIMTKLVLYLSQGDGTYTETDVSSFFPGNPEPRFAADFNGDGKSDVLVTDGRILLRTDTSFSQSATLSPGLSGFNPETYSTLLGNFGGNSAIDVLVNDGYRNRKLVFTNDGAGGFTRAEYKGAAENSTGYTPGYAFVFGDFDGDGKDDRLQLKSATGSSRLVLPDVTSITVVKNVCDRAGEPRIVDFDGSGTTDISFWNPADGVWSFHTSPDSLQFVDSVNWGLGSLGDIPAPGDFDGDGFTDRAVYRNDTGVWWIRKTSDLGWWGIPFGAPDDIPVPADYDGDTITDLAVFRPSDGHWYIWYMGTQQFAAAHFGADGDKPAPADFDGDHKTDIAVFRPSNGVWYYYRSSDGTYVSVQWGIGADRPMPADFDGDGKADITVFRDSDRVFYILRSHSMAASYVPWGAAGDIPVILDYEGDYLADVGQYRPATRTWWMTAYHPGLLPPVFGEAGVIPTASTVRAD